MNRVKHPLFILVLTLFINALGFGILIPIIPQLLANPGSAFYLLPAGFTVNQGYLLLGLLTGIFPLMMFFSTPILGELSDIFGRRRLLAFSLFGTAVAYLVFAIAIIIRNIPLLFISRAIDGITGGNVSVAQASIADISKPEDRVKNFGLIGASFGIGFVLGPFLGGILSDPNMVSWFNPSVPFYFAAALSFINVVLLLFYFEETNIHLKLQSKINWFKSVLNIIHAYEMPRLRVLFLTSFLFFSGFTFFVTFMSVFLINRFGFNQTDIGYFFSYIGIWVAITQAIITRQISKRFKEMDVIKFSIPLNAIAVALIFLPTNWWQLYLVIPLFAITNGLTIANLTGLISRNSDQKIQGEVLGINASLQALAQFIPPVIAGYIAGILSPEAPVVVASAVVFITALVFILFYHPEKTASV